ncbi:BA75_02100T0 [Komagataella pastoris]|uniref:BA75_02100T0 n=1 Tax=Komagataella pastoris TaxID=4922 RepID=A0A1B2JBP2_PICPA|nr:BA75_02100T0 [Komagataella pastoris]
MFNVCPRLSVRLGLHRLGVRRSSSVFDPFFSSNERERVRKDVKERNKMGGIPITVEKANDVNLEEVLKHIQRPIYADTMGYYGVFKLAKVFKSFIRKETILKNLIIPTSLKKIEMNKPVDMGSLVEFIVDDEVRVGVVIKPPLGHFKTNLVSLEVLTAEGKIIETTQSRITLHIPNFIDASFLYRIENDKTYTEYQQVQYALISLIHFTSHGLEITMHRINAFAIPYSHLSNRDECNAVSVLKVAQILPESVFPTSILRPYSLILASHIHMTNEPLYWQVHTNQDIVSRISTSNWDVNINSSRTVYIANSREMVQTLRQVQKLSNSELKDFRNFINGSISRSSERKSYMLKKYRTILNFLKHFIVYPHDQLKSTVSQILKQTLLEKTDLKDIDQKYIYDSVQSLDIPYEGVLSDNFIPDPYLSATMMGQLKEGLHATTLTDIKGVNPHSTKETLTNKPWTDKLHEIREYQHKATESTTASKNLKVYALPSRYLSDIGYSEYSEFAVSLEKINSRKWIFNVHIPDIVSFIAPDSQFFENLVNKEQPLIGIHPKAEYVKQRLTYENFQLCNGSNHFIPTDWIPSFALRPVSSQISLNCLTLSFIYSPHEMNWDSVRVEYKTDKISNVKKVSVEDLVDSLTNGSGFSLFQQQEKTNLSSEDKEVLSDFQNCLISKRLSSHKNGSIDTFMEKVQPVVSVHHTENKTTTEISMLKSSTENTFLDLFIKDVDYLTSDLLGSYSSKHGLPIFTRTQLRKKDVASEYLRQTEGQPIEDGRTIESKRSVLPDYTATSYEQLIMERGFNGDISMTAYVSALQYLLPPQLQLTSGQNVKLGMKNGRVRFLGCFQSLEVLTNHYQLLKIHINEFEQFRELIDIKGYYSRNLSQISNKLTIQDIQTKVETCTMFLSWLETRNRRFWILQWLKAKTRQSTELIFYKCIILDTCRHPHVARAYCVELDIEVQMVLQPGMEAVAGDRLIMTSILYISPIEGILVMR